MNSIRKRLLSEADDCESIYDEMSAEAQKYTLDQHSKRLRASLDLALFSTAASQTLRDSPKFIDAIKVISQHVGVLESEAKTQIAHVLTNNEEEEQAQTTTQTNETKKRRGRPKKQKKKIEKEKELGDERETKRMRREGEDGEGSEGEGEGEGEGEAASMLVEPQVSVRGSEVDTGGDGDAGSGLFATRRIAANEEVCRFTGFYLDRARFTHSLPYYSSHRAFVSNLPSHLNATDRGKDRLFIVDMRCNAGFVNSSSDSPDYKHSTYKGLPINPNTKFTHTKLKDDFHLIANRQIEEGEEIFYRYQCDQDDKKDDEPTDSQFSQNNSEWSPSQ
jgi:hypothetical protein